MPLKSAVLAGAAIALTAGTLSFAAPAAPNVRAFSGVWQARSSTPRLTPVDGKPVPFTAEGKSLYAANQAELKRDPLADPAIHLCLPEGMPRALSSPYPFQIIVAPDQVMFAHEANRAFRLVQLDAKHFDPDVWDPSYMGDGVAHWEKDTLVVDSTNFKADKIFLDASGAPVTEKLHLVEKIRLIDGNKRLEDVITIDDPGAYTRPWTVRLTFDRREDVELKTDWVCGEPHRDLSTADGTRRQ